MVVAREKKGRAVTVFVCVRRVIMRVGVGLG
jgi:hypothetical protein